MTNRNTRRRTGAPFLRPIITLFVVFGTTLAASGRSFADRGATTPSRFKAVAFDSLVLFDPDSILPDVEHMYPDRGRALVTLWRNRQFEYSWLRSMTDRYTDFFTITADALDFAARAMNLEMTSDQRQRLLNAYLRLTPWPDSMTALRRLRAGGIRIVALTNFTPAMLRANADHAGMSALIDDFVSTDLNHTFKPDPRAYGLAVERLHLKKQEILFAAFGGWDAAGAKAFGFPTVWVNRLHQPVERLGVVPDWSSPDLDGLVDLVLSRR
jgi:2-haloacid dehalogenase